MCFCYSQKFEGKDLCDTISPQILHVIDSLKMLKFQPHFLIKPLYFTTYTRKHIFHVFEAFKNRQISWLYLKNFGEFSVLNIDGIFNK